MYSPSAARHAPSQRVPSCEATRHTQMALSGPAPSEESGGETRRQCCTCRNREVLQDLTNPSCDQSSYSSKWGTLRLQRLVRLLNTRGTSGAAHPLIEDNNFSGTEAKRLQEPSRIAVDFGIQYCPNAGKAKKPVHEAYLSTS